MTVMVKRIVAFMAMFFMVIGIVVTIFEKSEVNSEETTTTSVTTEQDLGDSAKSTPPTTTAVSEETTTEVFEETTTATTTATTETTTATTTAATTVTTTATSTKAVVTKTTTQSTESTKNRPLKEGTIVDPKMDPNDIVLEDYEWNGKVINSHNGTVQGPNGKETFYNLPMSGVIRIMENMGYDYRYWVRDDGVKMYGPFVMVAADLGLRPRGSIIKTSRGWGMVCDTGEFAKSNPTQLDIAVTW